MPRLLRQSLLWISIVLLVFLLPACSKVRLIYRFADSAIVSSIDDYFGLTKEQKSDLKPRVKNDLRRLLLKQEPDLTAYMSRFIEITQKPAVTKEELKEFRTRGQALFQSALALLEPSITPFLLTLRPDQFDHYLKRVRTQVDEAKAKLTTEEAQRNELRRRLEWWIDFVGLTLNRDQRTAFEAFLKQAHYPFELEWKNQVAAAERFVNASRNPDTLKAFMKQFAIDATASRSAEFKEAFARYLDTSLEAEASLGRTLTPKQRSAIERKLHDLTDDLDSLRLQEAAEAPGSKT